MMTYKFFRTVSFVLVCFLLQFCAQPKAEKQEVDYVSFINQSHHWVDSVFNTLSPRERIAQLIMVRAHSNLGQRYIDSVAQIIEQEKIGGIVVFQGGPVRHLKMINRYQSLSKVPLLVSTDGEWGLGMRLKDSTISYPYQMALGAVQDDDLLVQMGEEIAKDLKRTGIHYNFAPSVDINNNPKNPVIGYRSFGDDREKVTQKAGAYIKGMTAQRVLSSVKHFPGHGDTDVDSHKDLPLLDFSRARLDSLELYPFRHLINEGVPTVMVGHMHIPALDSTPHISSSISPAIITNLLKKELGFKGLVVTDAMGMQGVVKNFPEGEGDVRAIEAGSDLLELSQNSARAIRKIEESVASGRLSQEELDQKVKKVLATKYWLGLNQYKPRKEEGLYEDLHRDSTLTLLQQLAEGAVTVLNTRSGIDHFSTASKTILLSVGGEGEEIFEKEISNTPGAPDILSIDKNATASQLQRLEKKAEEYDQVLLVIHDNALRPSMSLNYSEALLDFIAKVTGPHTVSILFTSPYILDELPLPQDTSVILGYQNDDFMQLAVLRALLNKYKTSGKLSVHVNDHYKNGQGF